ncbi:MAG: hypothetical protein AAGL24_08910 [Pseudomonadota bacterium]
MTTALTDQGSVFVRALSLTLAAVIMMSSVAEAKIKRGCKAWYEVDIIRASGIANVATPPFTYGQFSARRGCGNSVPNRCRRRARNSAHLCMNDHWNSGFVGKPQSCLNSAIQAYYTSDLKRAIQSASCNYIAGKSWLRGKSRYWISVRARTSGDKECPKKVTLSSSYRFRCG